MDFFALAQQCSSNNVENVVMTAIVDVESKFNPFAIGVVDGYINQPKTYAEAVRAVRQLQAEGRNFSVGLAQVNKINFRTYGLTESNMFDPCTNLRAGSHIFRLCYDRAHKQYGNKHSHDGKLRLAASCYYSGNFKTGFKIDFKGQPPYVEKFYSNLQKWRGNGYATTPAINQQKLVQGAELVAQPKTQTNQDVATTQSSTTSTSLSKNTFDNQVFPDVESVAKVYYSWDVFRDF